MVRPRETPLRGVLAVWRAISTCCLATLRGIGSTHSAKYSKRYLSRYFKKIGLEFSKAMYRYFEERLERLGIKEKVENELTQLS